ncbi:TetR/AcrR family transcriptional regulator C-terminal domain-containing protein [Streptomyces sp. NPDC005423]|uniref:TetR/AcrR family transcriptional regulator C-terminal domain-containing protein n=1 Tax=Streptomyces sp. NPDC005423 TaxID=3155343 RepID=UPI0033BD1498
MSDVKGGQGHRMNGRTRASGSGTGRGRRLGLTRRKVVDAAVVLIEQEGPGAFSLRKLAGELGVETMSLYNHVPNRDALLDDVAGVLLGRIDFSGADSGGWQDRVRAHAAAFRATARLHPKAFPLVCTRPTQSPAVLAAVRSALAAIAELGLPPREAVHVLRAYTAFITGTILRELGYSLTLGARGPGQTRQLIEEITALGDPLLTPVAAHLAGNDPDDEFHDGLELLIAGLAVRAGVPYDGGPAGEAGAGDRVSR